MVWVRAQPQTKPLSI